MKQVRLIKLELTNYRNIEHEVYVFGGDNAKIVGENRIGKTNTLEAIYFLLSNYLLDGSSELSVIKPLSDTKKEVKVEGVFEVYDTNTPQVPPKEFTLSKAYGEQWVKKRGTADLVMEGHYEEYFVNGIKQTRERDYCELLKEYIGVRNDEKTDIDPIQMLCNPLYLGNIGESKDWTKLRTYIVKLIGDVEDKEIFEKAPETVSIKQDLENAFGKTDQLKKMYSNNSNTLDDQLKGFEGQIDLLEKTTRPTVAEVEVAKAKVEEINTTINDLKANVGKDTVLDQLEKEYFQVSSKVVEMNNKEFKEFSALSKNLDEETNKNKIQELNSKIDNIVNKLTTARVEKGKIENSIAYKKEAKDKLAEEYKDIASRINNIDKEVIKECPTCLRPFDEKEIETNRAKILASYEQEKADIVKSGTALKNEIDQLEKDLKANDEAINVYNTDLEPLRKEVAQLSAKTYERPIFEESQELVALRRKAEGIKKQIDERKEANSKTDTGYYEKIETLESEKKSYEKVLEDENYYHRQMVLLESVKSEQKNVSNKLIEIEQKKEALKIYIYTKLKLLDEHIAKVFGKVRFQLIKENINGGFDPVCKPYIYDVDKDCSTDVLWRSGSKSEKIITGVSIVEAIRKELGLTELPFLFDEGGEISTDTLHNKFKTKAQIICVRVEDNINKPLVVKF